MYKKPYEICFDLFNSHKFYRLNVWNIAKKCIDAMEPFNLFQIVDA